MTDGGGGTAVEDALAGAVRDRQEADRLRRRLADLDGPLAELQQQVADRRVILDSETEDVEKLESFSPTRIWAGLRGTRLTDLDRESAERDAARYALAEAEARRDALVRERDAVAEQLRVLGDVDQRYAAALQAKDDWLRKSGSPAAAALADIAARRGELQARDRELAEAHSAGVAAFQHLQEADRQLASAGGWATWDTFGGGGMLTDMAKYDKMDKATAELRNADLALKVFGREMADVQMAAVPGIEVDRFTSFFDVFFDNIFSDWAVRNRLREAAERTRQARATVERLLGEISSRGREAQQQLAALDERREQLLLG